MISLGVNGYHVYSDAVKSPYLLQPLLNTIMSIDNDECNVVFADTVLCYKISNSMVKETITLVCKEILRSVRRKCVQARYYINIKNVFNKWKILSIFMLVSFSEPLSLQ